MHRKGRQFRPGMARAACVLGAVVIMLVAAGATTFAHGGELVFSDDAGPYHIEVYASLAGSARTQAGGDATLQADGRFLDYTVIVLGLESKRPAEGARVSLSATTHDGSRGPFTAEAGGLLYEVRIPAESVADWTAHLTIQGPAGEASVSHHFTPVDTVANPDLGWFSLSAALVLSFAGAFAVAVGVFLLVLKSRGSFAPVARPPAPGGTS